MAEILCIEDMAEVIRGIRRMLERRRHRVSVTGSGRSALRMLREHTYDVILLDILLPKGARAESNWDLDGAYHLNYEQNPTDSDTTIEHRMGQLILREMLKRQIQTPVILLSAYITDEIEKEVEELNKKGMRVLEIFRKPAKAADVVQAIERALAT